MSAFQIPFATAMSYAQPPERAETSPPAEHAAMSSAQQFSQPGEQQGLSQVVRSVAESAAQSAAHAVQHNVQQAVESLQASPLSNAGESHYTFPQPLQRSTRSFVCRYGSTPHYQEWEKLPENLRKFMEEYHSLCSNVMVRWTRADIGLQVQDMPANERSMKKQTLDGTRRKINLAMYTIYKTFNKLPFTVMLGDETRKEIMELMELMDRFCANESIASYKTIHDACAEVIKMYACPAKIAEWHELEAKKYKDRATEHMRLATVYQNSRAASANSKSVAEVDRVIECLDKAIQHFDTAHSKMSEYISIHEYTAELKEFLERCVAEAHTLSAHMDIYKSYGYNGIVHVKNMENEQVQREIRIRLRQAQSSIDAYNEGYSSDGSMGDLNEQDLARRHTISTHAQADEDQARAHAIADAQRATAAAANPGRQAGQGANPQPLGVAVPVQ